MPLHWPLSCVIRAIFCSYTTAGHLLPRPSCAIFRNQASYRQLMEHADHNGHRSPSAQPTDLGVGSGLLKPVAQ